MQGYVPYNFLMVQRPTAHVPGGSGVVLLFIAACSLQQHVSHAVAAPDGSVQPTVIVEAFGQKRLLAFDSAPDLTAVLDAAGGAFPALGALPPSHFQLWNPDLEEWVEVPPAARLPHGTHVRARPSGTHQQHQQQQPQRQQQQQQQQRQWQQQVVPQAAAGAGSTTAPRRRSVPTTAVPAAAAAALPPALQRAHARRLQKQGDERGGGGNASLDAPLAGVDAAAGNSTAGVTAQDLAAEGALRAALMQGYDPLSFPWSEVGPANVTVSVALQNILNVDLHGGVLELAVWLQLRWTDPRLVWDPAQWNNITYMWFANSQEGQTDVWNPDITLWNAAEPIVYTLAIKPVRSDHRGRVYWSRNGVFKVACNFAGLTAFPYGKINCTLELGSWTLGPTRVQVGLDGVGWSINGSITSGQQARFQEYMISGAYAYTHEYPAYPCCPEDSSWPVLLYDVSLSRQNLVYSLKILIPQVVLIMVAFSTFWLSPECGERLGLAVTVPLAVAVYDLIVFGQLPVSNSVSFVSACGLIGFLFSMAVLLENAMVLQLWHYREATYFKGLSLLAVTFMAYQEQLVWVGVLQVIDQLRKELCARQLAALKERPDSAGPQGGVLKGAQLLVDSLSKGRRGASSDDARAVSWWGPTPPSLHKRGGGGAADPHDPERAQSSPGWGRTPPSPKLQPARRTGGADAEAEAGPVRLHRSATAPEAAAAAAAAPGDAGDAVRQRRGSARTDGGGAPSPSAAPPGEQGEGEGEGGGRPPAPVADATARAVSAPRGALPPPPLMERALAPAAPRSPPRGEASGSGGGAAHASAAAAAPGRRVGVADGASSHAGGALPAGMSRRQVARMRWRTAARRVALAQQEQREAAEEAAAAAAEAEAAAAAAAAAAAGASRKRSERGGVSGSGSSAGGGHWPLSGGRLWARTEAMVHEAGAQIGLTGRDGPVSTVLEDMLLGATTPEALRDHLTAILAAQGEKRLRHIQKVIRKGVAVYGMDGLVQRLHHILVGGDKSGGNATSHAELAERLANDFNRRWQLLSALIDGVSRFLFTIGYVVAMLVSIFLFIDP